MVMKYTKLFNFIEL